MLIFILKISNRDSYLSTKISILVVVNTVIHIFYIHVCTHTTVLQFTLYIQLYELLILLLVEIKISELFVNSEYLKLCITQIKICYVHYMTHEQ